MIHQTQFTDIEAQAISVMIAKLTNEDYEVSIVQWQSEEHPDGEGRYYPYLVRVKDTDGTIASSGRGYFLRDALTEAYQNITEDDDVTDFGDYDWAMPDAMR